VRGTLNSWMSRRQRAATYFCHRSMRLLFQVPSPVLDCPVWWLLVVVCWLLQDGAVGEVA